MEKKKRRRARRAFTTEFKAEAVRLCRVGDRSIAQVAEDLDLTETARMALARPEGRALLRIIWDWTKPLARQIERRSDLNA